MKKEAFRALISLILFILCFAITLPFVTGGASFSSLFAPAETEPYQEEDPIIPPPPPPVTSAPEVTTAPPETTSAPESTGTPVSSDAESTALAPTTAAVTTAEPEPLCYENFPFKKVDKGYFSDALFIGDSRTVGIMGASAGLLNNAVFLCGESWTCGYSMNSKAEQFTAKQSYLQKENEYYKKLPIVYLGADSSGKTTELGRMNIYTLLSNYDFKKIYIMFGINEIGGTVNGICTYIQRLVDLCKQYRPDAKIILEGNLLMTAEYSKSNKYGGNDKLLQINEKIKSMADWKTVFYIDINDLMGDGNGNASTEYSNGAHPLYKHYKTWAEWLYTKGV